VSADGRVMLRTAAGHRTVIAMEDETGDTTQVQVQSGRSGGAA
jgi:hypothetical protein